MFIFTAIFYMIRSYLWKKIRKFIVCFFYYHLPAPSSLKSFIAFTITMYEYLATIPTLWNHVMGSFFFFQKLNKILTSFFFLVSITDFARDHPEFIAEDNSLGFMSSDNGRTYNLCHC